ncbi:MAG: ATP-dependent DNA helicase UvrD2 [Acidimicrobiia bacterium]
MRQLLPTMPSEPPGAAQPWEQLAGPAALGRNLVVLAGAEIPEPWRECTVAVVDQAVLRSPGAVIEGLRTRSAARERSVIELHTEFEQPPGQVERRPAHELGPRFTFELDELHHLVWSNSVDGRWPNVRYWPLARTAIELGAATGGVADVVLPGGVAAWLDGGPLLFFAPIDGVAVVHRLALEHGSLTPFGTNETTADLAPDQLAAVAHTGGAARIIAPAGSGKTRVLTERARHLLTSWRLPGAAVSLVAFNKRAQEEMRGRTRDLPGLQVRTLNAVALAIVNGVAPFAPQPRRFATIDEAEVRRIIGSLVTFPRRRNTDPVAPWIEALGLARLGLVDPEVVERRYDGDVDGFASVYPRYRLALERAGALDFDEQISRAIDVLLTDPIARRAAQRASRVLLVDEFQDLTPAHVLLVRLLAGAELDVFGVGDDDQTIYGYNGADPAWLIDFAQLFPGAGDHPLEVNYRCPDGIVDAADRLLRHNRHRVPKTIRGVRPGVVGWEAVHDPRTVRRTVEAVASARERGVRPTDIVVLTRVNSLLAPVQIALAVAGVPRRSGIGAEFAERTAVRAALAWVRLATATGPWRSEDLAEALRRPSRPLHPNVASWVAEQSDAAGLRRLAGRLQNERDVERVESFLADIERMSGLASAGASTEELVIELRDRVGLGGAVATLDQLRRGMNRAAQNDDLTAVLQLAELQPDPVRFPAWLVEQLRLPGDADGVTLATVHRVKGQEWPVVVVHQADADQFPHRLADDVEEERRLFHVAITRAGSLVTIVSGVQTSPFVDELVTEPPAVLPVEDDSRRARRGELVSPIPKASRSTGSDDVVAAPGLVLVDHGAEWTVEELVDGGVMSRQGRATRRFEVGAKVATAGGRRGRLTLPAADAPPAVSILAEDRLRAMRKLLADGRPAYVVFDDATIERIALAMPESLAELARVHGIGPRKLELYGDAVLVALEDARSLRE